MGHFYQLKQKFGIEPTRLKLFRDHSSHAEFPNRFGNSVGKREFCLVFNDLHHCLLTPPEVKLLNINVKSPIYRRQSNSYRVSKIIRSEERRVGKECRSR